MESQEKIAHALVPAACRWTARDAATLPVSVTGELPLWLEGQLVRTAPAVFDSGPAGTAHWFDGHGLLYGFSLGREPRFSQCLLASRYRAQRTPGQMGSFGTPTQRSVWSRLIRPVAEVTDNTNVNVVPWNGDWLALTESSQQHLISSDTLATRGTISYADKLPNGLNMLAHPHFEKHNGQIVNLATQFGPRNQVHVYAQALAQNTRTVEASIPFERVPYLHAFGRSPHYATLIDHPYRVNPMRMLFSNKSFAEQFVWDPARTTRLLLVDRRSGAIRSYETEALFCFHTVHQFEDGGDVVLDFIAYSDASIVDALSMASLARGLPQLGARLVRARLRPGRTTAELETLSDVVLEFPNIDESRRADGMHSLVWGTEFHAQDDARVTSVVRVDLEHGGVVRRFSAPGTTYGEPVFVADKRSTREGDGVLLVVGSKSDEARSVLSVLDAQTMTSLAELSVPLSIPLGFHGNFARKISD